MTANRGSAGMGSRPGWVGSVGPALIVAAVVCGPGSVLTASRVGARFGHDMLWVLGLAVLLMMGMTALASRLGVAMKRTACGELAARLGRPVALAVGLIVFMVVVGFQVSNNLAVVAAIAPMFGDRLPAKGQGWIILPLLNGIVLLALYRARRLYAVVELSMKLLVALMVLGFVGNWVLSGPSLISLMLGLVPRLPRVAAGADWMALAGLFATTFSIAGAFYQSYLVRDKGWGPADLRRGLIDSVVGIFALGFITMIVLSTAASTFHGHEGIELVTVGDIARQLEPLFGVWAKVWFSMGILAAALSSFLVNAMVGGQFLADGVGLGDSMEAPWTRHGTALALVLAMGLGLAALSTGWSHVHLIVVAQACTVLGGPALALTLLYLATRPDLRHASPTPVWMLIVGWVGVVATLLLSVRTLVGLVPGN
jgi:manganese transport protein